MFSDFRPYVSVNSRDQIISTDWGDSYESTQLDDGGEDSSDPGDSEYLDDRIEMIKALIKFIEDTEREDSAALELANLVKGFFFIS